MALLHIDRLTVSFDGIRALQDVSFSVEEGQIFERKIREYFAVLNNNYY